MTITALWVLWPLPASPTSKLLALVMKFGSPPGGVVQLWQTKI
jgi:hypothetical protein